MTLISTRNKQIITNLKIKQNKEKSLKRGNLTNMENQAKLSKLYI